MYSRVYPSGYYKDKNIPRDYVLKQDFDLGDSNPYRILFSEALFEKGKLFYIAENFLSNNDALIEYDLNSHKIAKEIFRIERDTQSIRRVDNNDEFIVFDVCEKRDKKYKIQVYMYDIAKSVLKKISEINFNDDGNCKHFGAFPVLVKNDTFWLEPDFERRKLQILEYSRETESKTVVYSEDFLKDKWAYNISITCLKEIDDKLVFGKRSQDEKNSISILNPDTKTVENTYYMPEWCGKVFTVTGSTEDALFVYGTDEKNELCFQFNLKDSTAMKLFGVMDRNNILHDDLEFIDDHLIYTIRQHFTGDITEHHFSEVYELTDFDMYRYTKTFDIFESDTYFGYMKFSEDEKGVRIMTIYSKETDNAFDGKK